MMDIVIIPIVVGYSRQLYIFFIIIASCSYRSASVLGEFRYHENTWICILCYGATVISSSPLISGHQDGLGHSGIAIFKYIFVSRIAIVRRSEELTYELS